MPQIASRLPLLLTVLQILCGSLLAQEPPESEPAEGRVIGKIWHTKVRFDQGFQYMNKVREELEIPQSPIMMVMTPPGVNMSTGGLRRRSAAAEVEMKGTLLFLETKPAISLSNPISFELIGSEEDFRNYVQDQKDVMGPAAELIGEGDRFELKLDLEKLSALGPGDLHPSDGEETADGEPRVQRTFAIAITTDVNTGDAPAEGPDAASGPAMPRGMSTYYRYLDGIMYSGRSATVHQVDLPTRDSLKLSDEDATNDLYADFDFKEVPTDLKRAFWSAVENQASVWLQRFDDEAAGDYSLRRAIAEGRLELLKTVLFDVDRAWFSMNLSEDDVQPIVAKLRIQARENSMLAGTLDVLSNSHSQLSVLQDDQSPLVISSTITLPEYLRPFSTAFVNSFAMKLKEAASETPGADILVDDLITPLQESAAAGLLDSAVCLRGSVETGFIPCGGMRLENAEQFVSSLEALLQVSSANQRLSVTHDQIGDYRMVSIRAEQATIPIAGSTVPVQLNLAATGSWLWFTVGGESAVQSLEELVTNNTKNLERSDQATPLLVRFRLNKWLGETNDELSKVPQQLLTALERWVGKATTPRMSFNINGSDVKQPNSDSDAFTSYAAKVFKPESSELELKVRTASREMVVDLFVGTALVKFGIAQFLESQNRMFKGMNFEFAPGSGAPGSSGSRTIKIGVGGAKRE